MRRRFDKEGKFFDTHGEYPDIVRAVAKENKVALIDMHRKSEIVIRQYGNEGSRKLFLQLKPDEYQNYLNGIEDNTHFSVPGRGHYGRFGDGRNSRTETWAGGLSEKVIA